MVLSKKVLIKLLICFIFIYHHHVLSCTLQVNKDITGNDLSSKQGQLNDCCGICQSTSGCKAYSWTNYNGGTCWLKSATSPIQDGSGVTLGLLGNNNNASINGYIRGCYFSDWAHYRDGKGRYEPEMYIPGTCTHIFFAFAKVNDDFTAGAYDDQDTSNGPNGGYYKRVNDLKNSQSGLKTILSFGGWSAGTATFKKLAANENHRKTFVNSAMNFINQYGFDGIDIDWEYPERGDYDNYISLLKDLKNADKTKLLTAAVTADAETVDKGYNVQGMSEHLDYVNVMTYDFHGDWESQTGENSPLFSLSSDDNYNSAYAMKYWNSKGMPKNKLLMGIATYGYGWKLNDPNNYGMNAPGKPLTGDDSHGSYYEICNMGGTRYWDATQKVPYRVNGNLWYGYDDKSSVDQKATWVKRNGFGGAFTWALDMDDFNGQCPEGQKYILHNAIKDILG